MGRVFRLSPFLSRRRSRSQPEFPFENDYENSSSDFLLPETAEFYLLSPDFLTPDWPMTLFEKIVARQIPAQIVYEDDLVIAFKDIKPATPTHILIVPKKPIPRIAEAKPEDHKVLGHLLLKAAEIAEKSGLTKSGFRLVINNGPDAGESVPHLHCHILGGRQMSWPPG